MTRNSYEAIDRLVREITCRTVHFFRDQELTPPVFRRLEVEPDDRRLGVGLLLYFEGHENPVATTILEGVPGYGYLRQIGDRYTRRSQQARELRNLENEVRRQYYAAIEDAAMRERLRELDQRYFALMGRALPGQALELQVAYEAQRAQIQEHFTRRSPYTAVDPAAPGADRTAIGMLTGQGVDMVVYDEVAAIDESVFRSMYFGTFPPDRAPTAAELHAREAARAELRTLERQQRDAAQARGLELLKENLTSEQLEQFEVGRYFEVVGGNSGKRYRIKYGRQQNVFELNAAGVEVCGWCFLTAGNLVEGDVMLAQKFGLELQEEKVLKIANKFTANSFVAMYSGEVSRMWSQQLVNDPNRSLALSTLINSSIV